MTVSHTVDRTDTRMQQHIEQVHLIGGELFPCEDCYD